MQNIGLNVTKIWVKVCGVHSPTNALLLI